MTLRIVATLQLRQRNPNSLAIFPQFWVGHFRETGCGFLRFGGYRQLPAGGM
jgi:hypothetical protein